MTPADLTAERIAELQALYENDCTARNWNELASAFIGAWPALRDAALKGLEAVRPTPAPAVWNRPAHTDHPLRHYDRTCPGCIASATRESVIEDARDAERYRGLREAHLTEPIYTVVNTYGYGLWAKALDDAIDAILATRKHAETGDER